MNKRQSSGFGVLWSRNVASPQESLPPRYRIISIFSPWHLFPPKLPASLPLACTPLFLLPSPAILWCINGSPSRASSLSSGLNSQERTLMDQQVPLPNNQCGKKRGQSSLRVDLERPREFPGGTCRTCLLLGRPASSFSNSLFLPGYRHDLGYAEFFFLSVAHSRQAQS